MTDNDRYAVELRNISKQYQGSKKKANNNINLYLEKGEILCIAGENGAGKTTLMKILCGFEVPDAGEIFINGRKEIIDSPLKAKKLGIGMLHQHFMLFPEYTAAENITMGVEPRKWGVFFDTKKAERTAAKIIEENNFSIDGGHKVRDLTLGEMQQVEICRVLHRNAQIIILDEPTSILTEQEISSFFKTLKILAAAGKSLILITHKLHEIKLVCDRVAVLRRGELAGVRNAASFDEYEIARLMMSEVDLKHHRCPISANEEKTTTEYTEKHGVIVNFSSFPSVKLRDLRGKILFSDNSQFPNNTNKTNSNVEPVIVFDNVTVLRQGQKRPLLEKVSFSVGSGEVLGFAGVGGNGLGVLEAVLGGFLHPARGKILHRGRDISGLNIRRLRNQGLAYVPADRLHVGSAAGASLEENMIINRRHEYRRGILIDKKAAGEFSGGLAARYGIEGAQADDKASCLSGGNLQKLILAREIDWFRDYIVFSQPAWGLDIASSRFIMEEISALAGKGAAVILVSTNLDEIIEMADRIMVMYRGRIAGEFVNHRDVSVKEAVGNCMQGLNKRAGE